MSALTSVSFHVGHFLVYCIDLMSKKTGPILKSGIDFLFVFLTRLVENLFDHDSDGDVVWTLTQE